MRRAAIQSGQVVPGVLAAILALCSAAAGAETLTYVLTPVRESGRIEVELAWETQGRDASALCVSPRWGSVGDIPRLVTDVQVSGGTLTGQEGACWKFEHRHGALLRVRYAVDAGRSMFDWNFVHLPIATRTFFHGVGNTFLLVPRPGGGAPEEYEVALRWRVPEGWEAVCSWAAGRHVGARLKVDDLRHSVYLAGELVVHTSRVEGAEALTVAMPDRFAFKVEAFAELAAAIIGPQCTFMEDRTFPPFVVTAIPVGEPLGEGRTRLSGTGLYRSFALFVPPEAPLGEPVEHLFAHENFHHWNGQVLRAAEPQGEVYWFTEGLTDYYALRILHESGRWSAATYADWINRHLRAYQSNPARNVSNAEIAAGYWTQRDTVGEVPYQRGLLLGLRWHRLARDRGRAEGIDALFKALVARGRDGGFQLTNEAVRQAGSRLLGDWFADDFDRYVVRAETVEVPPNALAPDLTGKIEAVYAYELGFDRERSLGQQRIVGLVAGSAAAKAGLREGDELAGWSIFSDSDRKTVLRVLRGGQVKTVAYFPRGERIDVLQFRPTHGAAGAGH